MSFDDIIYSPIDKRSVVIVGDLVENRDGTKGTVIRVNPGGMVDIQLIENCLMTCSDECLVWDCDKECWIIQFT